MTLIDPKKQVKDNLSSNDLMGRNWYWTCWIMKDMKYYGKLMEHWNMKVGHCGK